MFPGNGFNNGYFSASEMKSSLNGGSIQTELLFSSELLYDWRFTANQFVLAIRPLRSTTSNLFPTEPLRS
jgi:hypothetical protein